MLIWTIIGGCALFFAGSVYVRLRWHRAPQAYRAMVAVAATFLLAGAALGGGLVRIMSSSHSGVRLPSTRTVNAVSDEAHLPNRRSGTVVSVTDGDTLVVADNNGIQESIRLSGIDAPEHDQAFGAQSTEHLSSLVSGKNVSIECENERSYGRMICKVLLPNGEDVCLDQVKAGWRGITNNFSTSRV